VDLDHLIRALYDAALEPEKWPSTLELLGDALGGCAVGSSIQGPGGLAGRLAYARLDPFYFNKMIEQFPDVRANEMVAVMSGLPPAFPLARQAVKSDEAYFGSDLYNEIFAPQGLVHAAVACAYRSPDCFVPLGIFRRKGQEDFGQRQFDILKRVLPHLQRAIDISLRMRTMEGRLAASDDLLDRLPFGVILLDGAGSVRTMNAVAQDIVAANDGLTIRQGRLHAASSDDDRALRKAIASALRQRDELADPEAPLALSRPSGSQPLLVLTVPSPASGRFHVLERGSAIVFVTDPDRKITPSQTALMQLFDLTPTQSKLASLLARGESIEDAARSLGIKPATARVHVKSIFRKTDVARQSDLIRLILNSAVVLQGARRSA
jgi:DNA-binding CsgD family transcriptional regulator